MKKKTPAQTKKLLDKHPLLISQGVKPRSGVVIACPTCKKEFYRRESIANRVEENYCGRKCFAESLKTNTPRKCVNCGKEYYVSLSQVRYRNIQNCSKKCKYEQQSKKWKLAYRESREPNVLPRHLYNQHLKKGKKRTLFSYIKKLDKVFSEYIRKKYANAQGVVTCITCGVRQEWKLMDCGHFVNRNHKSLRFDERNCHPQCRKCNRFESGNMHQYALYLIDKYGHNILEELRQDKLKIKQWSVQELEEMIALYKQIINE